MKTSKTVLPLAVLFSAFCFSNSNAANSKTIHAKHSLNQPVLSKNFVHHRTNKSLKITSTTDLPIEVVIDQPSYQTPGAWTVTLEGTAHSYTFNSWDYTYSEGEWRLPSIEPDTYTITISTTNEGMDDVTFSYLDSNGANQGESVQDVYLSDNPLTYSNLDMGNVPNNELQIDVSDDTY